MQSPYATAHDYLIILNDDEAVELSRLTAPDAKIADAQKIERQLFFGSTEINTYLVKRYTLPFPSTIKIPYLTYANVIIAWHNMEIFEEREHVRKRYEDVIKNLKLIALGTIGMTDENGNTVEIISKSSPSSGVSWGYSEEVSPMSSAIAGYMAGQDDYY